MKRLALVLMCLAALALPVGAMAGKGPANKVTGDIWFTNPGFGSAYFAFSGHDVGMPADDKGSAYYADSMGYWHGMATSVMVYDGYAMMWVTVMHSTHPSVSMGSTHMFTFFDMGEPGFDDYFTYGGGPFPFLRTAGNIQVHFRA